MKQFFYAVAFVLFLLLQSTVGFSLEKGSAIVIAAFGTTYDNSLKSILLIKQDVEKQYPETEVRLAFTSNIIRKIWHERANDEEYKKSRPEVPAQLYSVKNVLGTLADLQNEGYKNIAVQPTLIMAGEEYADLQSYVGGLMSINTIKKRWKPFDKIAVGRPLTGAYGSENEYMHDIEELADALADDVQLAKKQSAALVYMGHGNEHYSTGIYYEIEKVMRKKYPNVYIYVGVVEGNPDVLDVVAKMKQDKVKKAVVKPLMVVAGDHANNDMAGDEPDSWKNIISGAGVKVVTVLEGLGDKPHVRKLFVDHLKDAAEKSGVELK